MDHRTDKSPRAGSLFSKTGKRVVLVAGVLLSPFLALYFYFVFNLAFETVDPGAFRDPQRFIAHAGGAVDGHTYTNTLEALDENYERGFRLFELDIMTTADGQFVAAHDWDTWARHANHQGMLPPTQEVFKASPVMGRYSPLDIEAINAWFDAHPDAYLVTDKVNDAIAFAGRFEFPDRLMMELFSLSGVRAAREAGILAPMLNFEVLRQFHGEELEMLRRNDITRVAARRDFMAANPGLAYQLSRAGIRIYVFNLHEPAAFDEAHVYCRELTMVYGMYADHWNFSAPPDCDDPGVPLARSFRIAWSRLTHLILPSF